MESPNYRLMCPKKYTLFRKNSFEHEMIDYNSDEDYTTLESCLKVSEVARNLKTCWKGIIGVGSSFYAIEMCLLEGKSADMITWCKLIRVQKRIKLNTKRMNKISKQLETVDQMSIFLTVPGNKEDYTYRLKSYQSLVKEFGNDESYGISVGKMNCNLHENCAKLKQKQKTDVVIYFLPPSEFAYVLLKRKCPNLLEHYMREEYYLVAVVVSSDSHEIDHC